MDRQFERRVGLRTLFETQKILANFQQVTSKIEPKYNTIRLHTKSPKVNRSREYRPGES